jgi:signal transduction histidine kinase
VIHVDDDGPGIADAEKAKVFDPFYRLDPARNVEVGGVGLGLSIAKAIVQAHDGQIVLADLRPHGLRVIVILPILPTPTG